MRRLKVLEPILILVLFLVAVFWLVNTLNTGNPLWFAPFQPTFTPSRIVVHHYGRATELRQGNAGFGELTAALDEAFSSFQNTSLVSIGIGDTTLRDYYESEFVIEVYYPRAIEFNLPIRMRNVNTLLMPIDGRHDNRNYVFIGNNREFQAGALQIDDRSALDSTLEELGYEIRDSE